MLNFRNTILIFIFILLVVLAADYLIPVSILVYAAIVLVFLIILAWGSRNINSGFYVNSLCNGDRNKKQVAITFDDGPDAQVTPMILDILKKYKIKAAFFIVGNRADTNRDLIKRMDKEGHIIGGHSYSHHFFFDLYPAKKMQAEMRKTDAVIYSIIGKRPRLFRPPYGVTNPPISRAIENMDYQSIGWSLRSDDTVIKDESQLLKNVTSQLQNGDIILFHDNKPWNVRVIEKLIVYLHDEGFEISRLDEFLKIQAYVY